MAQSSQGYPDRFLEHKPLRFRLLPTPAKIGSQEHKKLIFNQLKSGSLPVYFHHGGHVRLLQMKAKHKAHNAIAQKFTRGTQIVFKDTREAELLTFSKKILLSKYCSL